MYYLPRQGRLPNAKPNSPGAHLNIGPFLGLELPEAPTKVGRHILEVQHDMVFGPHEITTVEHGETTYVVLGIYKKPGNSAPWTLNSYKMRVGRGAARRDIPLHMGVELMKENIEKAIFETLTRPPVAGASGGESSDAPAGTRENLIKTEAVIVSPKKKKKKKPTLLTSPVDSVRFKRTVEAPYNEDELGETPRITYKDVDVNVDEDDDDDDDDDDADQRDRESRGKRRRMKGGELFGELTESPVEDGID